MTAAPERCVLTVDAAGLEKALSAGDPETVLALCPVSARARIGAAVRRPMLRVTVRIAGRGGGIEHRLWIDAHSAVLLLHERAERRELIEVAPALWTAALAGAIDLGPRRERAADPLVLDAATCSALLGEDPRAFGAAVDRLPAPSGRLIAILAEGAADAPDGAALLLVDTGDAWLLAAEQRDGRAVFGPSSASEIWRLLQRIHPTTTEEP